MREPSTFEMTPMYYADAAAEYLEWIKKEHPEHFMESDAQATQRQITVNSIEHISVERSDIHVFSEMLVQWRNDQHKLRRVVPDNMVVIAEKRPKASTNFAIELQKARPFFVLEYVSKSNSRKDYQQSYDKYEIELKVPYYLIFYPNEQELTLFKYNKRQGRYRSVHPDDNGHLAIRELDLSMALHENWVRYWWQGNLVPTRTDLQKDNVVLRRDSADKDRLLSVKDRVIDEKDRVIDEKDRRMTEMQAELERLRKSAG